MYGNVGGGDGGDEGGSGGSGRDRGDGGSADGVGDRSGGGGNRGNGGGGDGGADGGSGDSRGDRGGIGDGGDGGDGSGGEDRSRDGMEVEVKVERVIQEEVMEFVMIKKKALAQSHSHLCAIRRLRLFKEKAGRIKGKVNEWQGEQEGE